MKYTYIAPLGEGTYGQVWLGKDMYGDNVAIKKIRLEREDEGLPSTALREISLLVSLQHPNIVLLKDVEYDNTENRLNLVFEHLNSDLKEYMVSCFKYSGGVNQLLVKSYMYQMCLGIAYCHNMGVLHRDIKPQNLLIDKFGCLKIADFGLSRQYTCPVQHYTQEVVTLWYRCPEILLGSDYYGPGIDVWAIGCIFAELITGNPPWQGDGELDTLFNMFKILGTPNESTWPGCDTLTHFSAVFPKWEPLPLKQKFPTLCDDGLDLLSKLLKYDPASRISAVNALEHPYFHDLKQISDNLRREASGRDILGE